MELPATKEEFIKAQQNDKILQNCLSSVLSDEEAKRQNVANLMDHELLVCYWRREASGDGDWSAACQFVVPMAYRAQVLYLAHDNLWGGHLGVTKTYYRVLGHFYGQD